MKLPYNKYLQWLIITGKQDQDVVDELDNLGIVVPSNAVLAAYREKVASLPIPNACFKRLQKKVVTDYDSVIFDKLGFKDLYSRKMGVGVTAFDQSPWTVVTNILSDPSLRIAVECATIAGISTSDLVGMVQAGYKTVLTEEGITLFLDLYFDTTGLGKKEWRDFLSLAAAYNSLVYDKYFAALTKTKDQVMFLIGLPTKAAYADFLKNVLATASFKFKEYADTNTPDHDEYARKWAKIGFDAGARFDKYSSGDITDFARSIQTEFEYEEDVVDTLPPELMSQVVPPKEIENGKGLPDLPPQQTNDPDNI